MDTDTRNVLRALDNQKTSFFHFKTIVIAGMGFFTDAYDLFCISLVTKTIGRLYFSLQPPLNPLWTPGSTGFPNYVPVISSNPAPTPYVTSTGILGTDYTQTYQNGNQKYAPCDIGYAKYSATSQYGAPLKFSSYAFSSATVGTVVTTTATYTPFPAYDVINFKASFPSCQKPGGLPIAQNAAVTGTALCGTLAGQLVWGWLGDVFGRKSVYGYTLITMIVCAIGQSQSFGSTTKAVVGTLCFWRFFLGFGIGGDYPLSATIMSEYSSAKTRGAFVGSVFAMQGVGYLTAATVTIIFNAISQTATPSYGYTPGDPLASLPQNADFVWRAVLCFGSIPAALTMYWRSMMPETARYTALVKGDAHLTAENMGHVLGTKFSAEENVPTIEAEKAKGFNAYMLEKVKGFRFNNGVMLFGCAACWFLLDIAFYSQGLFQKDVFTTIGWIPSGQLISCNEEIFYVARAQALIALGSTIPGYWFTVFTVDYIGRWWIQLGGFFMMTLWMAILAGDYNDLVQNNVNGFVVMYALTFFFANWGPNSTTFIIPAELFAARFRSTCHGISAASGKAGAIIGAFGFLYASQAEYLPVTGPVLVKTSGITGPSSTLTATVYGAVDYAKCSLQVIPSGASFLPCNSMAINPDTSYGLKYAKTPDSGYPNGAGLRVSLGILAATNFAGMLCCVFVPETLGRTLEDLSGEEKEESVARVSQAPMEAPMSAPARVGVEPVAIA